MRWPRQPLLVLGLSAWAAGALAWWLLATLPAAVLAAGLAGLAGVAWLVGLRIPGLRVLSLLLMCGVIVGASAVVAHLTTTRPAMLREAAGEQVTGVARITSATTRHSGEIGSLPSVRATAVLSHVSVGGAAGDVVAPVVLLGDTQTLGQARPERGAVVSVVGRLLPERPLREPGLAIAVTEVTSSQPPTGWPGAVRTMRESMWEALAALDGDAASLVAGLAIGDDSRQRADLATAMRDSGLSHLTAVSGGNIAIVAGLVVGVIAVAGGPLQVRVAAGASAVIAYAAFVGPEPSVLRAGVMGVVALVGVLRGSRGGGYPLLGFAVLVLALWRPGLVLSWGFALSVAATGGILGLAPAIERRMPRTSPLLRGAAAALAVTLGAQLATAPLLAAMTGQLPLAAVPANLAAAPLVVPITVLGLAVTLISSVHGPAGRIVAELAEPFGAMLAAIARWGAGQSWATLTTPTGLLGAALVAAAVAVASAAVLRLGAWRGLGLAAAMLALALFAARPPPIPGDWVAAACDVGQGDAFVVRVAPAAAVLIDTGPDIERLTACLDRLGVAEVPLLLLTHYDTDHVAAAPAVLAHYRTATVLASPVREPASNADDVRALVASSEASLVTARPGMRMAIGGAGLRVLWPQRIIGVGSVSNNAAVVVAVTVGGFRLLFTGDLEPPAQAALMAAHPGGDYDAASIPHHGSAAQDPRFLRWTGAALGLVSAGQGNRFGHPSPEALALAAAAGQTVGRTDRHGTLVLVPNGRRLQLVSVAG